MGVDAGGVSVVAVPFWRGAERMSAERAAKVREFFAAAGGEWELLPEPAMAPRARHPILVFFSPESGIPPKEILHVVKKLRAGAAVVTGSRFHAESIRQGGPAGYLLGEKFIAAAQKFGGAPSADASSGLVCVSKDLWIRLGKPPAGRIARLARAAGSAVAETGVMWIARRPDGYDFQRRFAWGDPGS